MPTYEIYRRNPRTQINSDYFASTPSEAWSLAVANGDIPEEDWTNDFLYEIIETSPLPLFDQFTLFHTNDPLGNPYSHPLERTTYGTWSNALSDLLADVANIPLAIPYLIRMSDSQRYNHETETWGEGGLTTPKNPSGEERP